MQSQVLYTAASASILSSALEPTTGKAPAYANLSRDHAFSKDNWEFSHSVSGIHSANFCHSQDCTDAKRIISSCTCLRFCRHWEYGQWLFTDFYEMLEIMTSFPVNSARALKYRKVHVRSRNKIPKWSSANSSVRQQTNNYSDIEKIFSLSLKWKHTKYYTCSSMCHLFLYHVLKLKRNFW